MPDKLNPNRFQLLTIKQFVEKNPWPGESALRKLFDLRKSNGMERAFLRTGRRIIVDEEMFFDLMKRKNA